MGASDIVRREKESSSRIKKAEDVGEEDLSDILLMVRVPDHGTGFA